jgi:hypothetical protein
MHASDPLLAPLPDGHPKADGHPKVIARRASLFIVVSHRQAT